MQSGCGLGIVLVAIAGAVLYKQIPDTPGHDRHGADYSRRRGHECIFPDSGTLNLISKKSDISAVYQLFIALRNSFMYLE